MADDLLAILLQELPGLGAAPPAVRAQWLKRARRLAIAWPEDALRVLRGLGKLDADQMAEFDEPAAALLAALSPAPGAAAAPVPVRSWNIDLLAAADHLAAQLKSAPRPLAQLLRALSQSDDPAALELWAKLLVAATHLEGPGVDAALVPLFQRRSYDPGAVFPKLWDGLSQPGLATGILDLANYLHRNGRTERHLAADRAEQLVQLLGELAQRLQQLEERPAGSREEHAAGAKAFQEMVPLVIALCDAVALLGDRAAEGKLNQVMSLRHRRLRTEAACALARLGEKSGVKALVELTREPVVRNRALAYLDEVGALDEAPAEMRTSEARGEGDLAAWLAAPAQFGLAPQQMELLESQSLQWPGYDEPVDCHLFSFEYHLPQGSFSGIGLAGPVTHAFGVDLQDYPPADIFAIYCGWNAEHAELRETDPAKMTATLQIAAERARRDLIAAGYADPRLVKIGHFFGEQHFVFETSRGEGEHRAPGIAIVDGAETHWYPLPRTSQPPSEREIYWLHRGKKLFAHFNQR